MAFVVVFGVGVCLRENLVPTYQKVCMQDVCFSLEIADTAKERAT